MAMQQNCQKKRFLKLTSPMMRGGDVKALQRLLKGLGYTITDVDGIFGRELDGAVRAFQEKAGLQADGIVGSNTYRALDQAEAESAPTPGPSAEPTNNAAERAVRSGVLWRKGSFGTQTAPGSRFVERMMTVVATLKQQKRNVLEYLHAVPIKDRDSRRNRPSLLPNLTP